MIKQNGYAVLFAAIKSVTESVLSERFIAKPGFESVKILGCYLLVQGDIKVLKKP